MESSSAEDMHGGEFEVSLLLRLHTMMEKVLEGVAYEAPERGGKITVDEAFVEARLADIVKNQDLSHYIL